MSEGKTHAVYKAHSYHTKVPHLAIVPSILHYTEPGDIILDGFSGSGQTGVAAQWCGAAPARYRAELENKWKGEGHPVPEWGARHCVLNDLSPTATFISSNYNQPFDTRSFGSAARALLADVEQELGWMYETLHSDGKTKGRIEYTVWSEVFTCPDCTGEIVFLNEALDEDSKAVVEEFPCPSCSARLNKRNLERRFETGTDKKLDTPWRRVTFQPVLISYKVGKQRFEKVPDPQDIDTLKAIDEMEFPEEIPSTRFPVDEMYHGSRIAPKGLTHIHHFFLPRAAQALGALWRRAKAHPDVRMRHMLMFLLDQSIWGFTIQNRYRLRAFSHVNQCMTGVYYVPSQTAEVSPWYNLEGKIKRLPKAFETAYARKAGTVIATCSTTARLSLPDASIDYIFTDPPFGENIYYADLNFLVESWYGVFSNARAEAIVDRAKNKALPDYQELMRRCFAEYHRVLKAGRWITIVFHNSRNAVWNAIQEALQSAGFVVADVRTLDKQQGSYRQVTSTATKQDLVISAYKPNGGLEERFRLSAGTEQGVWDFVSTHLKNLPRFDQSGNRGKTIAERTDFRLYDRMVSFHVLRGVTVPLSASEFYAGLAQRYPARDGMYFLPEQTVEYDRKRLTVEEIDEPELFVLDEATAREWLREFLKKRPSTFQELHPQFIREIGGWQKHETPLELSELLGQNFLCYDGNGPVPEQIHAYLSSNWRELRNLSKDDPTLRAKARDRWYVPDPNRAGDLEKLREKALLKEFDAYKQEKKKLKVFRLEAVRAGFRKAWVDRDYATIVAVADKIPTSVLEEDPKLLMWYDQASTRMGGDA
ncbi:DNA methyltransferase [Hoeflea sp.]|uniref:DNA methyltransferase n=1 Tax=Hoeflea sp. TaxID=1940281 RepID=UPI003B0223A9